MLLALLGITTFSQGCSKDDDDGGTEVVNGGSNNNDGKTTNENDSNKGDNTSTNNGDNTGTNNGGETKTDPTALDWKVEWDYISDDFFPSWTYMQLTNKNMADYPECVTISMPKDSEGARIKLTVEGNKFMDQTVVEETVTADMIKKGDFSPDLNWKEDALVNAGDPGFFNLNAVLEINGKVVKRFNKQVNYRSINECVFAWVGTDGRNSDFRPLFSIYVNEDNPNIDKILKQCLALGKNRQFIGNQGTKDDVLNQMWWVWQYFSMRGTKYSSITTNSSNNVVESADGTKIYNQSVRFFDQCYNEKGANCVDGSCMLASIYRKIGLDVALVLVPKHCFLAVRPNTNDVKGQEDENIIFLETTLMDNTQINGVQYNPNNADDNRKLFDFAIDYAEYEVEDNANKHGIDEVKGVYIANARAQGFKPIQRTQAINVEVLDAPIVLDFTPSVDKVNFNKSEHKYIGYYSNENNAYDNTDYNYRYTIGFTLTYPNAESIQETGFIIGDALFFNSNGAEGQGCLRRWQYPQNTASSTMYYYSNSTSATVFVQGYCIDKYGKEHWSSKQQVNCVYSTLGTK